MPRRTLLLTIFCTLAFAHGAAHASTAPNDKDLRKAGAVAAKLRLLEAASSSGDAAAFRNAAGKIYPGLFSRVAEVRDAGLKADLSTAASLYEAVYRGRASAFGARPDCSREMRSAYFRLCAESADLAAFLFAKARMHTRFAEAALGHAAGLRDEATFEALARLRAERDTDLLLAEEGLRALKELAAEVSAGEHPREGEGPREYTAEVSAGRLYERLAAPLGRVERVLASLPRGEVYNLLRNARDAFRDGLSWQLKTLRGGALVASANSFDAPDPLRQMGLDGDSARRAARDNWRGALKFIGRAEEVLGGAKAGE